ncbi:MAG: urease accessory protein UreE [Burkholderiales bacterium]
MAIVVATRLAGAQERADEVIELAFEQREKSRFRARLLSGEEIGVDLAPGTLLRQGDRIRLDDGRVVAVEAAPERLIEVHAHDAIGLARIAYHVGNRHVPLQLGEGWIRLLPDHVLQAMIERLGGHVHAVEEGFQPESGAYGHSHVHHQHDDQGHGGRIHVFDPRHDHDHAHDPAAPHVHGPGCGHDHAHEPAPVVVPMPKRPRR